MITKPGRGRASEPNEIRNGGPKHTWFFWFAPLFVLISLACIQAFGAARLFSETNQTPTPTSYNSPPVILKPTIPLASPTPPKPTETILPATTQPAATQPVPSPTPELVRAHLSYYWPPFGEINCDYECEHIANGDGWQKWVGKGVACPVEYPLGTVFIIMGKEWTCVDRGDAIVRNNDGSIWLDLLVLGMPDSLAWGSIRTVEVRAKGGS